MGIDFVSGAIRSGPVDGAIARLADRLRERYGERVDAIILYGSYLRGVGDAMPDIYVLLNGWPAKPRLHRWLGAALPPNVLSLPFENGAGGRAKVSVLTTAQLMRAVTGDRHPYFWARFAQPCQRLHCRNRDVAVQLDFVAVRSAQRLMDEVAPNPCPDTSAAFWMAVFARTYAAEVRSEGPGKHEALYAANPQYYDRLFEARQANAALERGSQAWPLVKAAGKLLSSLRIVKSALTFEDAVDYMLWKLERHSGVRLDATERQRRYPLLFAWPLAWRLYRLKAFR